MAEHLDREYVLGTHDAEVERLGIQHDAWRPYALECWDAAGVHRGDRVLDVGAGPGWAAYDLAKLVGPRGAVVAVERSARFAAAARAGARQRQLDNLTIVERDLVSDSLPSGPFDASWCRWVCSFLDAPEPLIIELANALRPGGVAMFHEYVDYASWRFSPRLPLVEEYISRVMHSWREAGGEPDIAMSLPPLLAEHGFEVLRALPRVFCVGPTDPLWSWISTFVCSNLDHLGQKGDLDLAWAQAVRQEFLAAEADASTLMLTPAVLEIIAARKSQ